MSKNILCATNVVVKGVKFVTLGGNARWKSLASVISVIWDGK